MASRELISIIVPVFNEGATVAAVLDRLKAVALPAPREIIVVDDGSVDDTGAILRGLDDAGGALRIVHTPENRGKGRAIRLGLAEARGTIVAIQDADLELDPHDLVRLVEPILAGAADVVYGSRFLAGRTDAPWLTLAANAILTEVTNMLFGSTLTDMETCYKVMRTSVARSLALESDRFDVEPEITAKLLLARHRIVERPVSYQPRSRAAGKKIGWRDGVRALGVLLRYRLQGVRRGPG